MASQTRIAGTGSNDTSIGSAVWDSPGNITTVSSFATSFSGTQLTNYLRATNFGFSIPAEAEIDGIEVIVGERTCAEIGGQSGPASDHAIRIVKGGSIGSVNRSEGASWPITPDTGSTTFGSESDLWGETWTPADINNSGFGAVVSAQGEHADSVPSVGFIRITVHYTVSPLSDAAFFSGFNIDKIVRVWEDNYNKATDTTTRTSAFGTTIYVHAIPHNFTRPLFTTLLWSEDGGTTWQDGGSAAGGNSATAFSDSSNVYIATTSNSGTLHYKLIGSWIHDYDDTNPLVESFEGGASKLIFDSRANYQKIALEGSGTYPAGTFGSEHTETVTHNLDYIPNAKMFSEYENGEVWPMTAGGLSNPFAYDSDLDESSMRITSTTLTIRVFRFSNAVRRFWYRVYYDA